MNERITFEIQREIVQSVLVQSECLRIILLDVFIGGLLHELNGTLAKANRQPIVSRGRRQGGCTHIQVVKGECSGNIHFAHTHQVFL